jgi:hypothetical protein
MKQFVVTHQCYVRQCVNSRLCNTPQVIDSIVLIILGILQMVQFCVGDVCATIRRISDGYFSHSPSLAAHANRCVRPLILLACKLLCGRVDALFTPES